MFNVWFIDSDEAFFKFFKIPSGYHDNTMVYFLLKDQGKEQHYYDSKEPLPPL